MQPSTCSHCGAPADPAEDTCPYCRAKRGGDGPSAGLRPAAWEERLKPGNGRVEWGTGLTIHTHASPNDQVVLRSHALLDDVDVRLAYRFSRGQGWATGLTASALGVCVRASSNAGYDVTVTVAGLVSISRYAGGKLDAWLLEPSVHELVRDGLDVVNEVGVCMRGDVLTVQLNGRSIASVRDGARRSGAVELHVRPGAVDATVVVSELSVSARR